MEYRELGKTGIRVSRLCFGSLTVGPLQANLSIDEGASVIAHAIEGGVNFIDAAELYRSYPYIKAALKKTSKDVIISSRSYAYTREMAVESIEKARREMDRDVIDIFGLHEQESEHTLRGHREAIEYFLEAKQKGIIRAVLITTHHIEVVNQIAKMPEIDIIHPLYNKIGFGIMDGSIEEMSQAIQNANEAQKGVYAMKALAGGHLLNNYNESLMFVLDNPNIHAIAVGMKSIDEVDINLRFFNGEDNLQQQVDKVFSGKEVFIQEWCEKCGNCIKRCPQKAMYLDDDKVMVDKSKCLLCGYCGSVCPSYQIRII